MVIVLIGAAGAGKTTVGRALAAALDWRFLDADDLHDEASVERMRAGIPLGDADRRPWLDALHGHVARALQRREGLVLACSALKARYRTALAGDLRGVRFVYLKGRPELLADRLGGRRGHFAGAELLPSQLAALEEPLEALEIDAAWPAEAIVGRIRREFGV